MQDKQFTFIPWWISSVLIRNNLKTEDLLSFERIRPFFSVEDLTSLVAANTHSVVRFFVCDGIGSDTAQLWDRWLEQSSSDASARNTIATITDLAFSSQVKEDTLNRLVIEPAPTATPNLQLLGSVVPSPTFEVALMGDKNVAVHLKQGFTLLEHNKNSLTLLRCMVKKLYVYEDYPKLVSRDVGLAYIESLID